jgi:hypothetical protein
MVILDARLYQIRKLIWRLNMKRDRTGRSLTCSEETESSVTHTFVHFNQDGSVSLNYLYLDKDLSKDIPARERKNNVLSRSITLNRDGSVAVSRDDVLHFPSPGQANSEQDPATSKWQQRISYPIITDIAFEGKNEEVAALFSRLPDFREQNSTQQSYLTKEEAAQIRSLVDEALTLVPKDQFVSRRGSGHLV